MTLVTLGELLEAGVHFGHQSSRWNPKMFPYIYTEQNGIHVIDLVQTARLLTMLQITFKKLLKRVKVLFSLVRKDKQLPLFQKKHKSVQRILLTTVG